MNIISNNILILIISSIIIVVIAKINSTYLGKGQCQNSLTVDLMFLGCFKEKQGIVHFSVRADYHCLI